MTKAAKNMGSDRSRSGTLNMRIDPKLKYLADLAAKYTDRSLSHFIEDAIKQALAPERITSDEVLSELPLWGEGLWDEDEATRLFMLATMRPTLLNLPKMRLWTMLSGAMVKNDGKITLKRFVEWYNSPVIDKKHLTEGE